MSDLRRKILDASVALIDEKGVRSVSFREVARRAGVSHQAPYHHFGNYQGILREISREGFTALATGMKDAADKAGGDPLERMHAGGLAYVSFALERAGHFRVMFEHAEVDVWDVEEPVPEAADAFGVLMALATACIEAGYAPTMTTQQLAQVAWSCVHGLATLLVEGVMTKKFDSSPLEHGMLTNSVVSGLSALLRSSRSP